MDWLLLFKLVAVLRRWRFKRIRHPNICTWIHTFILFFFFFYIVYVTVVAVVVFEMLTIKQQTVTHIHMHMGIAVFSFDLNDGKLGSMLHTEKSTDYFRVIVCWEFISHRIHQHFRPFPFDIQFGTSSKQLGKFDCVPFIKK